MSMQNEIQQHQYADSKRSYLGKAFDWVYGSDEATIIETITNGRGGVMPGWVGRLDETTVKALTVYVHALGGGQ